MPRRVIRRLFYSLTWKAWSQLASLLPRNGQREHFLGIYGALSMALLFGRWIASLNFGFGLLLWVVQVGAGVTPSPTLGSQLLQM
ncbi:MAG: hypothetical protein WA633_13280 [Stellaceae bacterium]